MWGLPAIVRIAIKRMLKQGGLTLLAMLGVTFAVAFCTAIPLYTNTVYNRVLQTELYDKRRSMPAFGLLFRYKGQPEKNLSWDDIQPVRDYLTYHSASALALPQKIITQFVVSPIFDLYPPDQTQFEKRFSLTELSFGTQSDVEDHISIVREVDASPNPEALNILVSEQMLYYQGWTIGQQFIALLEQKTSLGLKVIKIPIQISGIWTRTEPKDPYWFFNPTGLLEDTLLLPESTYEQQFAPLLDDDVANALWYMILDGDAFRPNQTEAFLRRLNAVTVRAGSLLPNLELMVAPAAKALREFQAASRWLTVAMFALSVPVLVIIIIFLGMVVSFITQHQRAEIAILRSRGATEEQTIGIAAVQAIVIGAFAMTAGTPLGRWIAVQLAKTRGFLNFSGLSEIELLITPANIQIGLAIICGLVLAMGGLTIQHLNHTVVRHHQDMGRSNRKPWWQKTGFDIILLLIAIYGVTQLRTQEILPTLNEGTGEDFIKQNPLLYLVPALCSVSLTLVTLRLLPFISGAIAKSLRHTKQVASLLAVRQLSRQSSQYTTPIIILVLTLSLAIFTSSMATTLQYHENTQAYREAGADLRLLEYGENTEIEIGLEVEKLCVENAELACPWENEVEAEKWIAEMGLRNRPRWRFLPIDDHLQVDGVRAASPVGQYNVQPLSREIGEPGIYLGVDRSSFIDVAYWEPAFADQSLGNLMNILALDAANVLVSRDLVEQWSLTLGDSVPVQIRIAEPGTVGAFQEVNLVLKVAGFVEGFPTWDPDQGPLFVGNLDYLFTEAGGHFPHYVWLKTDPDVKAPGIATSVRDLGFKVQTWQAPAEAVNRTLGSPEFQGLMGLLSTGFVISACLTVLGLVLYVFYSFKRRSVEVGALRAIGFAKTQVTALMIWELVTLMLLGSLEGTAIGLGISHWLIPYMRLGDSTVAQASQLIEVFISWNHVLAIYALFAVLFAVMVVVLITALNRIRLYAVLKMGDTI